MDQIKRTGREVETETKKQARELDGHDLGDDIANTKDEAEKDLGNLGDDVRRGFRDGERKIDDSTR